MRYTGPLRIRTAGDEALAGARVGIARSLVGRLLAHLGESSTGAQRWKLDDGTEIRARVGPGFRIVEIDVRGVVPPQIPLGYYFVYAFGGVEGQPRKVYGWRVDRGTDRMTPIEGMPMDMDGITDTTVVQFADNYQHGSDIVVLVGSEVWQYAASPTSGKLELVRQTGVSLEYSRVFATQDADRYVLYKSGGVLGDPSWGTYDATDGSVNEYGVSEPAPFSYARDSVGMTWRHPTLPMFYRSGGFSSSTEEDSIFLRRYSYSSPGSPPVLEEEWSFYGANFDAANGASPYTVTPSGDAVVVGLVGGLWLVHRLNPDGSFASHAIQTNSGDFVLPNEGGLVGPPGFTIGTAGLLANDALTIRRSSPPGSSSTITNHSIAATGSPNVAATSIGVAPGTMAVALSTMPEEDATRLRSGMVPLLDGSRIIASAGRNLLQTFVFPFFEFDRDISMNVLKPVNVGGGALGLAIRNSEVMVLGADAGETTDYLSAVAVFEPLIGMPKPGTV